MKRWLFAAHLGFCFIAAGACGARPGALGPYGGQAAGGPTRGGSSPDAGGDGRIDPAKTTVVLFLVDGLMYDAVQTAVSVGAPNLAFVLENGVRVETAHSTSPAAIIQLPADAPGAGGPQPWGYASSGNVAVHTGTHLFESSQMDDIFLGARAAGIKSVFSGGADNYAVFTTPDFHYAMTMDDDVTVQHAIDHLRDDHVRLIRVHLQRIRDFWTGPADKTDPYSYYIAHLLEVDGPLGTLIQALKDAGVWESTYLVVTSDHGMVETTDSAHSPYAPTSWNPFMAFYGPDIKKGATIPYAELPDVAVTTMRFFHLPPLKGHMDPLVDIPVKGPTGTLLTNLFVGAPDDIVHPLFIQSCLSVGAACMSDGDDFAPYRLTMLSLIK